jgi:hypothetical protein
MDVMRGLDPRIHLLGEGDGLLLGEGDGLPGQARQSRGAPLTEAPGAMPLTMA